MAQVSSIKWEPAKPIGYTCKFRITDATGRKKWIIVGHQWKVNEVFWASRKGHESIEGPFVTQEAARVFVTTGLEEEPSNG